TAPRVWPCSRSDAGGYGEPSTGIGRRCGGGGAAFFFGGGGPPAGPDDATVFFVIENFPCPGSSRRKGGESSVAKGTSSSEIPSRFAFSRCLVTTVRRRRSLVRRARVRAHP